jgi:DMSO/TMAO reductase YedYZ molybdopterin-dependent catalytic subunit
MTTPGDRAEQSWQDALAAGLVGRSKEPLNCELPPDLLGGAVTATGQFFRRNHFPIPDIDPDGWRLRLSGLVRAPASIGLAELKAMPAESLTVTLECAGNGRALFNPPVGGEQWGLGAVSTACWTGARLRDVLALAGREPAATEVIFRGADGGRLEELAEPIRFERSLSVRDAEESGALLAYAMNGEPLPARHGFPVRLIVPGWYAVASVKWLTEIVLASQPFRGFFQDTHYVYEWRREHGPRREPVRIQRVRAMVTEPAAGQQVPAGGLVIRGVAWSGSAPVTSVSVRVDTGGQPTAASPAPRPSTAAWQPARLLGPGDRYGWRRWELPVADLPAGPARISARATDAAGHDQLGCPEWNALGYGGNFVHAVTVTAV